MPLGLEDSPEQFVERFREALFEAELLPTPMGYPLLEIALPGGVLYAFDRGAPPTPRGKTPLLLHGVVLKAHLEEAEASPQAELLAGGRYRLRGRVVRSLDGGFLLFESVAPVVLYAPGRLEANRRYTVELAPPLMGFRP